MNRHIKRVIQLRLIIAKHNYKCNESSCLLRGKIKKGNIISIEKFEHCTRREYLQDIMHAVRIDLAHEEEIFYRLASYYATMDFLLHYTGWHRDLSIQRSYHGRYHLNSREGFNLLSASERAVLYLIPIERQLFHFMAAIFYKHLLIDPRPKGYITQTPKYIYPLLSVVIRLHPKGDCPPASRLTENEDKRNRTCF